MSNNIRNGRVSMNDYPTEEQLATIECWDASDLGGLMAYIKPIWNYSDCGYWKEENGEYRISTGGWSGNEDIIEVMNRNFVWWSQFWYQSNRGGHYIFGRCWGVGGRE